MQLGFSPTFFPCPFVAWPMVLFPFCLLCHFCSHGTDAFFLWCFNCNVIGLGGNKATVRTLFSQKCVLLFCLLGPHFETGEAMRLSGQWLHVEVIHWGEKCAISHCNFFKKRARFNAFYIIIVIALHKNIVIRHGKIPLDSGFYDSSGCAYITQVNLDWKYWVGWRRRFLQFNFEKVPRIGGHFWPCVEFWLWTGLTEQSYQQRMERTRPAALAMAQLMPLTQCMNIWKANLRECSCRHTHFPLTREWNSPILMGSPSLSRLAAAGAANFIFRVNCIRFTSNRFFHSL